MGFCKSAGDESSCPLATKKGQCEAPRGASAVSFGVSGAPLGTPGSVLGGFGAASGLPLKSLGHAPGSPEWHFRWLQGPSGRSLGRFPRTCFCRKCVRCLKSYPQPDATCACRRGCITSDEASSCSIQATHSPLTQSKTKQLQMHRQAAAAKR